MHSKTAEIRYQRWMQIIKDWSCSGLTKRIYCQQNGIDEKRFYYYQMRIRILAASQIENRVLPSGSETAVVNSSGAEAQKNHPQIVKLQLPENRPETVVDFTANGMRFSVSEEIPVTFLVKLLEAVGHGSR